MTDRKDIPVAIVSPDPYFLFAARGMLGKDRRARICCTANSLEAFRSDLSGNKPMVKVLVCDLDALGPLPAFFKALADLMADFPSMAVICLAEGTIEQAVPYLENTPIDALLSKHDLSYGLHLAIHTIVDHGVVLLTQSIWPKGNS